MTMARRSSHPAIPILPPEYSAEYSASSTSTMAQFGRLFSSTCRGAAAPLGAAVIASYLVSATESTNATAKLEPALSPNEWRPFTVLSIEKLSPNTNKYTFMFPDMGAEAGLPVASCLLTKVCVCDEGAALAWFEDRARGRQRKKALVVTPTVFCPPRLAPSNVFFRHAVAAARPFNSRRAALIVAPLTVASRPPLPENTSRAPRQANIGAEKPDGTRKPVIRPYTPTSSAGAVGHLDLVVKIYEAGVMSAHIGKLAVGDALEMKGPIVKLPYEANTWPAIGMVAGGTGITPMLQVAAAALADPADKTKVSLVYGNVAEDDILLRDEIDAMAKAHPDRFEVGPHNERAPRQHARARADTHNTRWQGSAMRSDRAVRQANDRQCGATEPSARRPSWSRGAPKARTRAATTSATLRHHHAPPPATPSPYTPSIQHNRPSPPPLTW